MEKLRIAIQKSGRLYESSVKLLKECGLSFDNGYGRLKAPIKNFPAELLFLRDDDIPEYIHDGVADSGIIGENIFLEKRIDASVNERLGFSRCRLSLAIPKDEEYTGPRYFDGRKIATSHPNITRKFLDDQGVSADIHFISGSVEIAPGIGLAEAICDIVSSGSTLFSNGLVEVETLLESEAILISHPNLTDKKRGLLEKLLFRINAVKEARNNKYILLNAPDTNIKQIIQVIPGMKSPTVMPLARSGWSSLHSVVNENDFWEKIDQLRELGAEGILVVPIEKMIV